MMVSTPARNAVVVWRGVRQPLSVILKDGEAKDHRLSMAVADDEGAKIVLLSSDG